jgi:hypothetical protein
MAHSIASEPERLALAALSPGSIQTGLQSRPVWMDLTFKSQKPRRCPGFTTEFHRWITAFPVLNSPEFRPLTGFIRRRRTGRASAVDDSNPGDPNLEGHAAPAVVLPPNGDSHPAARPVTSPVMDAYFRTWPSCATQQLLLRCPAATYPLGRILRQPAPVSFSGKRRALLALLQPSSHLALRLLHS